MSQIEVRSKLTKALELLNDQLSQINNVTDKSFQTSGLFKYNPTYNGSSSGINIHNSKDLDQLLYIGAFLKAKKESYDSYAKSLGLETFPVFRWQNYSYDQWDNDLKIRITVISAYDQKKKITDAKQKLERFLTEEDQLAMTLKELGLSEL